MFESNLGIGFGSAGQSNNKNTLWPSSHMHSRSSSVPPLGRVFSHGSTLYTHARGNNRIKFIKFTENCSNHMQQEGRRWYGWNVVWGGGLWWAWRGVVGCGGVWWVWRGEEGWGEGQDRPIEWYMELRPSYPPSHTIRNVAASD